MNVRKLVIIAGMGAGALCLIGAGAGATFTDSTHSVQTIQAGHMDVQLSAPGDPSATQSPNKKTVTLADAAPVNSTFKTDAVSFEILNNGDIPVKEVLVKGTRAGGTSAASDALFNQTNVCLYSPYIDSSNPGGVVFDGKLSTFVGNGQQIYGPLAPGAKDHYTAEYYAGNVTTACGAEHSDSLNDSAQGGRIIPQIGLNYEG